MPTWWIYAVAGGFVLSVLLTDLVGLVATKIGLLDHPDGGRKRHAKPVPLLGGVAVFLSFALVVLVVMAQTDHFFSGEIEPKHLLGLLGGGLILVLGGALDDKFDLKPRYSIIFPVAAALMAVAVGIGPSKITNPFGSAFEIPQIISSLFTFGWLMCLIYTTKFLDGLDGLATGISAIGTLMIALLALSTAYFQPDVAVLALIAFSVLIGFLLWNLPPAQVFLGEGGSTFLGFLIGTLAIISGSKVATALLVVGIPALDVLFVLIERFKRGHSLSKGDRLHLHHKLFDLGLSSRQIIALYFTIAITFGITTLVFASWQKLIALVGLFIIMCIVVWRLSRKKAS